MIRHICMFKLKEENKEENIAEFFERIQILKDIPEVKRFEVVRNCEGAPESNYDVSLIFDFDSLANLEEYQKNELHVSFGRFVATVREERACIDYEI